MTSESTRERFKQAVRILADEPGTIKQRLMIAYVSQLSQIDAAHELPEQMIDEFDRLKVVLSEDEVVGDRGKPSQELERMSDEDASKLARRVFEMFLEIYNLAAPTKNA